MKYLVPILAGLAVVVGGAALALTLILPHTGSVGPVGPRGSTGQQGPRGGVGPTVVKIKTKIVHVPVPGPTVTEQAQPTAAPAPTRTSPPPEIPTRAEGGPIETYCTYERMDTAVCANGGTVTVSNAAYDNALAQNPNDPGAVLSGEYPLSEVQGGNN